LIETTDVRENEIEISMQSSPTTPRAQRKAESRRRILDAARAVFFRDGFMAANLDEIAERAGVAKGTLYRYFESKADLYVAVLADNSGVFTQKMKEAAQEGGESAREVIEAVSHFYLTWWQRHPEYFQIFWALDNQAVIGELPTEVVQEVSRLWESSLAILADILQRGVAAGEFRPCDTWEVANTLWTTATSIIQSQGTETRRSLWRKDLESVFEDFIVIFLQGIRAQS
jgi:AcrR family transcriptional regulator